MNIPPYRVSVRENDVGGGVRPAETEFVDIVGHSRLTFFVHGYNTSEFTAAERWNRAYRRMAVLCQPKRITGVVLFFWPGDTFRSRPVSGAFYPWKIKTALDAGRRLAEFITALGRDNPDVRIQLVGHSLGCRVVLSAAAALAGREGTRVHDLVLLGAAVPEGLCTDGRSYAGRLATAREEVLFSTRDEILDGVFRTAQAIARATRQDEDPGTATAAVGLTGHPRGRWTGETTARDLGHCDYWDDDEVMRRIASLMAPLTTRQPTSRQPERHRNRVHRTAVRRPRSTHRGPGTYLGGPRYDAG